MIVETGSVVLEIHEHVTEVAALIDEDGLVYDPVNEAWVEPDDFEPIRVHQLRGKVLSGTVGKTFKVNTPFLTADMRKVGTEGEIVSDGPYEIHDG